MAIEDLVTEDLVPIFLTLEKGHAGGGRLFTGRDLLEIGDIFYEVPRPTVRSRRGILMKEMIGGNLHGRPGAAHKNAEHDDKDADIPPN